jgi:hypothetical protein
MKMQIGAQAIRFHARGFLQRPAGTPIPFVPRVAALRFASQGAVESLSVPFCARSSGVPIVAIGATIVSTVVATSTGQCNPERRCRLAPRDRKPVNSSDRSQTASFFLAILTRMS